MSKDEETLTPFAADLLSLLDLIEQTKDWKLATDRFAIAEKYGMTVKFGENVSGEIN